MSLVDCPTCKGTGRWWGTRRTCYFCHGRKKITKEFLLWQKRKKTYTLTTETSVKKLIEDKIAAWEKKNPKPIKFEKK